MTDTVTSENILYNNLQIQPQICNADLKTIYTNLTRKENHKKYLVLWIYFK
jgi:hypothetical protein